MSILENFQNLFIEIWQQGISGINFTQIGLGIVILLLFLLLRGLISSFILKRLENYVAKTSNKFDDALVEAATGPVKFLPIVLGIFVSSSYIEFDGKMLIFIDNVNRSLITILIFWLSHQIVEPLTYLIRRVEELLSKDLLNWVVKANKILIIFFGFAATLDIWGIKIAPIIAGLGLFGVAVALGAQDLFKNLISGVLVLVEKRFKIGDWIFVEGVIEGIVERIGFRSTLVRRFDSSPIMVPNFNFAENAVTNFSNMRNRRIYWTIGLEYRTTHDQLKNIRDKIENYITANNDFVKASEESTFVRIEKLSDSSIDLLVYCFAATKNWGEWLKIKENLAYEIKQIVETEKAGFAFPSASIYHENSPS